MYLRVALFAAHRSLFILNTDIIYLQNNQGGWHTYEVVPKSVAVEACCLGVEHGEYRSVKGSISQWHSSGARPKAAPMTDFLPPGQLAAQ
jgi:hypothetical protein